MLQGLLTSLNNQQQQQQQQQQQGVGVMDESFSNLTSASGEASASNSSTNPSGSEAAVFTNAYPLQQQQYFNQQNPNPPHQQPTLGKRKRSLPGNPDPDSEVIALSPKTLMAKNRFMCEICNKGFQRDQNLQLHRRGHNLPWKLKQRSKLEVVRKKVYVCPESSCVHHDPSRALGDLTGIKKHFCRKHGEKKWKCEKCNKRYAVQSDLKAHSKTCGTREYRCDCGTLFSRRDSFITHRAFCDALTVETARSIATNPLLLPPTQQTHLNHQLQQHNQMINLQNPQLMNTNNSHDLQSPFSIKQEQHHHENQHPQSFNLIPPWLQAQSSSSSGMIFTDAFSQTPHGHTNLENPNNGVSGPPGCFPPPHPQMSATALLQRAAQIGATLGRTPNHMPPMTAGFAPNFPNSRDQNQQELGPDFFTNHGGNSFLHDMMMNPFSNSTGNENLTRDFLGLAPLSQSEILSMAALGNPNLTNVAADNNNPTASSSSPGSHHEDHHQQRQNQSWHD